jgi:hypothetical protein
VEKPKEPWSISWVWVALVVVILFVGMYGYATYDLANRALNSITAENAKFQIINISLLPPSITVRLTAYINNPSSEDIYISGKIDYYSKGVYITTFNINNQLIRALSSSIINIDSQITAGTLISMLQSGGTYTHRGYIEARYTILGFIQLKVTHNISG